MDVGYGRTDDQYGTSRQHCSVQRIGWVGQGAQEYGYDECHHCDGGDLIHERWLVNDPGEKPCQGNVVDDGWWRETGNGTSVGHFGKPLEKFEPSRPRSEKQRNEYEYRQPQERP